MPSLNDMPIPGNMNDPYGFGADDGVMELNPFLTKLLERNQHALDGPCWDEAVADAELANELGVTNEDEYRRFHYIDLFVEDIVDHLFGSKLPEDEQDDLKKFMFKQEDVDFDNLLAFYAAALKWLADKRNIEKEAYPNRVLNPLRSNKPNVVAWATLAQEVRKAMVKGIEEKKALAEYAKMLHPREQLDFIAWYRFKFGKYTHLYDVNKIIQYQSEGNMTLTPNKKRRAALADKFAGIFENEGRYYLPDLGGSPIDQEPAQPFQTENAVLDRQMSQRLNEARTKLIGRTVAIDKLLDRYSDVLDRQQISEIEDALNVLRKKVRMLATASMVKDVSIKTANQLYGKGWSVGGHALITAVEEFAGESLKLHKRALDMAQVQPLVTKLQEISNALKRKDMVRDIARVDFQLHDMDVSALFPELSEAQAKLVDATGYASNKIDDVISKIRSTQSKPGAPGAVPGGDKGPPPQAPEEAAQTKPPAPKAPEAGPPAPPPPTAAPEIPAAAKELEREIARE